jgi:hypothetical protein
LNSPNLDRSGQRKNGTADDGCAVLFGKMAGEGRKPGSVPRTGYPDRDDDHSSRADVADGLKQPTRELRTGRPRTLPYSALLRMGFTELPASPPELVSSYLTLSPLPAEAAAKRHRRRAVCSLWHFPWGHPRSPLGTILPCGARTFLSPPWPRLWRAAIIWPSPTGIHSTINGVPEEALNCRSPGCKEDGCSGDSSGYPAGDRGC